MQKENRHAHHGRAASPPSTVKDAKPDDKRTLPLGQLLQQLPEETRQRLAQVLQRMIAQRLTPLASRKEENHEQR